MTREMFRIALDHLRRLSLLNFTVLALVSLAFWDLQDYSLVIYYAVLLFVISDLRANSRPVRALPVARKEIGRVYWVLCVVWPGILSLVAFLIGLVLPETTGRDTRGIFSFGNMGLSLWLNSALAGHSLANLGLSLWINSALAGSVLFFRIHAVREIKPGLRRALLKWLAFLGGVALYVGMASIKSQFSRNYPQLRTVHWLVLFSLTALSLYAWFHGEHLAACRFGHEAEVFSGTQAPPANLGEYSGFKFFWRLQSLRCAKICLVMVGIVLGCLVLGIMQSSPGRGEVVLDNSSWMIFMMVLWHAKLLETRTMRLLPVSPRRLAMHYILSNWVYGLVAIMVITAIQMCFLKMSVVEHKLLLNLVWMASIPWLTSQLIMRYASTANMRQQIGIYLFFCIVFLPSILVSYTKNMNLLLGWSFCLLLNAASFGINYYIVKRLITRSSNIYRPAKVDRSLA